MMVMMMALMGAVVVVVYTLRRIYEEHRPRDPIPEAGFSAPRVVRTSLCRDLRL